MNHFAACKAQGRPGNQPHVGPAMPQSSWHTLRLLVKDSPESRHYPALLNLWCNEVLLYMTSQYTIHRRTGPWLWIGKPGQANKSHKPTGLHCFIVVADNLSISQVYQAVWHSPYRGTDHLRGNWKEQFERHLDNAWGISWIWNGNFSIVILNSYLNITFLPSDPFSFRGSSSLRSCNWTPERTLECCWGWRWGNSIEGAQPSRTASC